MICFYSNGNSPGGVQSIQINLIECFSKQGIKCKLFDSNDGWVRQTLLRMNVNFECHIIEKYHDKKDYSSLVSDDDFFIMFNGHFFECLLLFGNSKCKILFWEVYYPWIEKFISIRTVPLRILAKKIEIKILNILISKNGMVFIDQMGIDAVSKRLNVSIKDKFLPIPVKVSTVNKYLLLDANPNESFNISYVCRALDWKLYPIIKFIKDIQSVSIDRIIKFHIVTDDILKLNHFLEKNGIIEDRILFYKNLNEIELEDLILKSHLHIGMGTSALDGAKLGVPTILIDASNDEFPSNYLYRWIYETEYFDLGRFVEIKNFENKNSHDLNSIFNQLINNNNEVSEQCYNYVLNNYNVNNITRAIITREKETNIKFNDFKNLIFFKYYRLLRFFKFI
jgi:hypothetical protein